MKKRLLFLLLCLLLLLSACTLPGGSAQPGPLKNNKQKPPYEVVLLCGSENDSAAERAGEALESWAKEGGHSFQALVPETEDSFAYMDLVTQALELGARLILCTDAQQSSVLQLAAAQHPEIYFLTVGFAPGEAPPDNLCALIYNEAEAGFLAGYYAVAEGYAKLGFLAAAPTASAARYGSGFLQGVNAAAQALSQPVEVCYSYGTPTDQSEDAANLGYDWPGYEWFIDGTELLFAGTAGLAESYAPMAEASSSALIGLDSPIPGVSDTMIAAVRRSISQDVTEILTAYDAGLFPGGERRERSVKNDGVELLTEPRQFTHIPPELPDTLRTKLADGTYRPLSIEDVNADPTGLVGPLVSLKIAR